MNFNNAYKAMEALTAVATLEGWVPLYYRSADCAGVEKAPILNHNEWSFLFYFFYIVVISLFFMQLVLAFVVVTYVLVGVYSSLSFIHGMYIYGSCVEKGRIAF